MKRNKGNSIGIQNWDPSVRWDGDVNKKRIIIFQFESSDLTWIAMLENRLRFAKELLSCREIVSWK